MGDVTRHELQAPPLCRCVRGREARCSRRTDAWRLLPRHHRNVRPTQPEMARSSHDALYAIWLWHMRDQLAHVSVWREREVENEGVF